MKYWIKYRKDGDLSKGVECMLAEYIPDPGRGWVTIAQGEPADHKVFFHHPRGRHYVMKPMFYGKNAWHHGGIPKLAAPYSYSSDDITKGQVEPHAEGKTLAELFEEDET